MSDRHEKWVKVEPGTVIPAGQPYRVEYNDGTAGEYLPKSESWILRLNEWYFAKEAFIDSSWKPPLVLPTVAGSVIEARLADDQEPRIWFLTHDYWVSEFGRTANGPLSLDRVLFDAGDAS